MTKVIWKPTDMMLSMIDQVAKKDLAQIETHNFKTLNVLLYWAAVTIRK